MREFEPARRPREAQGTDAASSHRRVSGANGLTPGILPFALRASFAVRAAPAAQWLLLLTNRLERFEPRPRLAQRGESQGWDEG